MYAEVRELAQTVVTGMDPEHREALLNAARTKFREAPAGEETGRRRGKADKGPKRPDRRRKHRATTGGNRAEQHRPGQGGKSRKGGNAPCRSRQLIDQHGPRHKLSRKRKPGTNSAAAKAIQDREITGSNHPISGRKLPQNHPGTAATKSRRNPPSGPKTGSPGTVRGHRHDPGENGPENARLGAENREFSGPPEFDKKLHRYTANLASIS